MSVPAGPAGLQVRGDGPLPEVAAVYWRHPVSAASVARDGRIWTLSTVAQVVPFVAFALFLTWRAPVTAPVGAILLVHAWMVPALYASRGANVMRPKRTTGEAAQTRALGMLADLIDTEAFDLHAQTGLVLERGRLGTWLVGEAGAILVPGGGRRAHCYCVSVRDTDLPSADRIAHLLLALRCDEAGFATVANRAFAGAPWRVRRRMPAVMRPALDAAVSDVRGISGRGPRSRRSRAVEGSEALTRDDHRDGAQQDLHV